MEGSEVSDLALACLLIIVVRPTRTSCLQSTDVPYKDASPLALAVWRNQADKVRELLRDGADVNKHGPAIDKGNHGDPLIHLAIKKVRYSKVVQALRAGEHFHVSQGQYL